MKHEVQRCGSPDCLKCHCQECEVARRSIHEVGIEVDIRTQEVLSVRFGWFVPASQFMLDLRVLVKVE